MEKFPNVKEILRLLNAQPVDAKLKQEVTCLVQYAEWLEERVENLSNSKEQGYHGTVGF